MGTGWPLENQTNNEVTTMFFFHCNKLCGLNKIALSCADFHTLFVMTFWVTCLHFTEIVILFRFTIQIVIYITTNLYLLCVCLHQAPSWQWFRFLRSLCFSIKIKQIHSLSILIHLLTYIPEHTSSLRLSTHLQVELQISPLFFHENMVWYQQIPQYVVQYGISLS